MQPDELERHITALLSTAHVTKIVLIAVGGALGSVMRYAIHTGVQRWTGGPFPAGTLVVNVVGCLIIGALAAAVAGPISLREELRLGLMVGLLGGFTTFSAFGIETFSLANDKRFLLAGANMVLSVTLGLAAVWVGFRAVERWLAV